MSLEHGPHSADVRNLNDLAASGSSMETDTTNQPTNGPTSVAGNDCDDGQVGPTASGGDVQSQPSTLLRMAAAVLAVDSHRQQLRHHVLPGAVTAAPIVDFLTTPDVPVRLDACSITEAAR